MEDRAEPILDEATARQVTAADPARSTWVTANAGSGKTRVLTNRVARLLLGGARPDSILCLTYTKAAAAEMQNRLFATLGEWAMAEDTALADALARLGVSPVPDAAGLDAARRLFASAIETPGGLRIQTIHAFCAGLLRRFPLEARVSPQFRELDDRSLSALIDAATDALAEGPECGRVDALAAHLSGDESLHKVVAEILRHRQRFAEPLRRDGALAAMGLPPGFDADRLAAEAFDGGEADLLAVLLPSLRAGGANDGKAAEKLAPLAGRACDASDLPLLEGVLLSGKDATPPFCAKPVDGRGAFPSKAGRKGLPADALDALQALALRVQEARPRRLALASAERTLALHRFAAVFLPEVARRKAAGGWLDFDDLILTAQTLLSDPSVADWVLWKLDGGIAHILVDEAQDTSPDQWQVIRLLARDMGSGTAAGGPERTLFVVGDRKQSIYSFQGADPEMMDPLREGFAGQLAPTGGLAEGTLAHSFRSAPAILQTVDAVFGGDRAAALGEASGHRAFHDGMAGRVDLWPAVEKPEKEDDPPWHAPVDRRSAQDPAAVLADRIADEIARLLSTGARRPDAKHGAAPLTPGDILILVQRRGPLFSELLRACKQRKLPLAGADRLKVGEDLAVKDLLSLLAFLSLQDDDLALAEALRSPLFGWSEDDLYRLAQPRGGRLLWQALRQADAPETLPGTLAVLRDLRDRADFLRPYDLLERILVRHGGRRRLLSRLGPEREEAIDALLGLALAYEQAEVPSLTGFLEWMRADDAEVKRQAEGAGGLVRVMTVHGAKGLEAPVVILPDCADRRPPTPPELLTGGAAPLWRDRKDACPEPVAEAMAEATERAARERLRLLYVAMTRAQSWLIVCAAGNVTPDKGAWHDLVAQGLADLGAAPLPCPTGETGLRWQSGDWPADSRADASETAGEAPDLPGWATIPASPAAGLPGSLKPSGLGGAKALAGDAGRDEATALRRGTLLHLLLEHLPRYPEASWAHYGPLLLDTAEDRPLPDEAAALLDELTRVLTHPDLQFLFAPGTLAEADVSAALPDLPGMPRLHGAIDRLVIGDEAVLAVDFKSNQVIPDRPEETPEGLLRQMGAYAAALAKVFPGRRIDTAILWTAKARLMPLPPALTAAALSRAEP